MIAQLCFINFLTLVLILLLLSNIQAAIFILKLYNHFSKHMEEQTISRIEMLEAKQNQCLSQLQEIQLNLQPHNLDEMTNNITSIKSSLTSIISEIKQIRQDVLKIKSSLQNELDHQQRGPKEIVPQMQVSQSSSPKLEFVWICVFTLVQIFIYIILLIKMNKYDYDGWEKFGIGFYVTNIIN